MQNSIKYLSVLLLLATTFMLNGCASAYNCYEGSRVNCQYCPQPALPFTHYAGCKCHSRPALQHLQQGE